MEDSVVNSKCITDYLTVSPKWFKNNRKNNTKSSNLSFDNISIKIISEQNDFILDQCALYNKIFLNKFL